MQSFHAAAMLFISVTTMQFHQSRSDSSLVQFSFQEMTASELQEVVDAPIERSGDLGSYLSVRCVTERGSAQPGNDYVERPDDSDSAVVFFPGERTKSCGVRLLDDAEFEPTETFLIRLKSVQSSDESVDERLASNGTVLLVRIINDEDTPTVEFQRNTHSITRIIGAQRAMSTSSSLVAIIRKGDQNHTSRVRVLSTESAETSSANSLEYRPINKVFIFQPGDRVQFVEIDVLNPVINVSSKSSWQRRTFTLKLRDVFNAKVGNVDSVDVIIVDGVASQGRSAQSLSGTASSSSSSSSLLSSSSSAAAPMVISLLDYDDLDRKEFNWTSPPPPPAAGHPLICVTPCDERFPGYDEALCLNDDATSGVRSFAWEVAAALDERIPVFRRLREPILFARVDEIVLDSVYFRAGFWVRCVAQFGTEFTSAAVVTSRATLVVDTPTAAGSCGGTGGLQSESFVATLKYSGVDGDAAASMRKQHANRLHVHVQIPHQDGLLPLISTRPLHNPAMLLLTSYSPVQRSREHPCSNLLMPGERDALLNDGFLKYHDSGGVGLETADEYPHEHDATLRSNATLLLYRHLNRKRCLWTFDAWYHMAELVELCGGYTLLDSPQLDSVGQTTVRVPLYVSYVFASPHRDGWTSIERHTEMDFSFAYTSVLWNSWGKHSNEDGDDNGQFALDGRVHVQRIAIGEAGKMVIDFQTIPNFRGLFVAKHKNLPCCESRLIPSSNLILSFDLQLLWTAKTFDEPTQTWRAVSNYSLKDYTGTYVLELIPCTVTSIVHSYDDDAASQCTPHAPRRFELPIEFQQTNRPVAVIYSLNTHFELFNDESAFLSPPFINLIEHDWTFAKDEKILGRVLWHPTQDLQSAYRLTVKQVYGCTGRDDYVPVYDPTGEEYGNGPQFGCIRPNKRLLHRIVLLDRGSHTSSTSSAKFADDVPEYRAIIGDMAGVDGFVIPVNSLYSIDAGQRWFLQAVYTIEPSAASNHHYGRRRERAIGTQNGTNIRSLRLVRSGHDDEHIQHQSNVRVAVVAVLIIGIIGVLLVRNSLRRIRASQKHADVASVQQPYSRCIAMMTATKKPSKDDDEGTEV